MERPITPWSISRARETHLGIPVPPSFCSGFFLVVTLLGGYRPSAVVATVRSAVKKQIPIIHLIPIILSLDSSTAFYKWVRDLHLYAGLTVGPFVLVFALSAIMFNHGWIPWGGPDSEFTERTEAFTPPPENDDSLVMGKAIMREFDLVGEIGSIQRQQNPTRLTVLIQKPGVNYLVKANFETQTATVREKHMGVWTGLVYLHTRPGMHLADLRGNWFYMKLWGWIADATVYLTLFLTISGVYMWLVLRAERRAGLLWLGAGFLTFFALVWMIVV